MLPPEMALLDFRVQRYRMWGSDAKDGTVPPEAAAPMEVAPRELSTPVESSHPPRGGCHQSVRTQDSRVISGWGHQGKRADGKVPITNSLKRQFFVHLEVWHRHLGGTSALTEWLCGQ